MTKQLKRFKSTFSILSVGLVIASMAALPVSAAQTQQTIVVTATVQAWMYFAVSSSAATLTPALVNSSGVTNIGSSSAITMDLGTNATGGWSMTITGTNNGLASTTAALGTIATVDTSSSISAGSDGYGAQATSTKVIVAALYNSWLSPTNIVGAVSTTANTLMSTTSAMASSTVGSIRFAATSGQDQAPGTYTDTVTLTATTSP